MTHWALLPLIVMWVTAVTAAFALWKGDTAARIAGTINFVNAVALPAFRMISLEQQSGEVVQLAGDLFWAIGLLMLVVRYASPWLGVTMLLQAVQFSLHAYYMVMELPHDLLHAWVNNLDEVGISVCITVGVVLAIHRRSTLAREAAELEARRNQRASSAS